MKVRSIILFLVSIILIGGGLWVRSQYPAKFSSELFPTIQKNVESEFRIIEREARELLRDQLSDSSKAWDNASHYFIHADRNRVITWNRSSFLPDLTSLSGADSILYNESSRGDFLVRKWPVSDGSSLFCILTLTARYPIVNNFLTPQWNPSIFPVNDLKVLSPTGSAGTPILVNGEVLFRVYSEKTDLRESTLSFFLLIAGSILLLVVLWNLVHFFEDSWGHDRAFMVGLLGLLSIRLGMVGFSLPALFLPTDVFDPKKFASSFLNSSVGDLFLNAVCVLALMSYLFLNFRKFFFVKWLLQRTGYQRFVAGATCLLAAFFALLFPYNFVEVIYHNSSQSLDITQSLLFDGVRVVAIASVLAACISSFLFIHVLHALARHLLNRNLEFFSALGTAALIFFVQYYLNGHDYWVTLGVGVLFFVLLKVLNFNREIFQFSFQLFMYLIFSLTLFSLQNALGVRLFHQERQVQDQFRFGKDFLTERDVLGEYLLDQARQRIEKDQFIQTRMAGPVLSKSAVVDKIRRVHLNNYFDRYEVAITTRIENKNLVPGVVRNSDSTYVPGTGVFLPSGYSGISFTSSSDGNTVKRYHATIPIYYQRPVGSVELDLSLKRVVPENVFPELLVDNRFNQIYRNRDFSYAVFAKGKWINSFGSFNYERDFRPLWIEDPALYRGGMTSNSYDHIGIEEPGGSVAIVSASAYSWSGFITNFSFWFVLGLGLLFVGQGALGGWSYFKGKQFNYTARIQLFIFLAFLLPVLAVSITTLTLIGRSSEEAIEKDFLGRSVTVGQRIATLISGDSIPTTGQSTLEDWIEENAASSKIDISVYSPDGRLIATSQPALFEDQLISPMMDREAWKKIVLQREVETVTNEQIGTLQYKCAYSTVRSPDSGELKAVVGLPFFESAAFLQKNQSLILSNILIVFVVVFILFSLLSFWASSSLTFPIRFITKMLGQTTLTGKNKPLQWNSTDEIGTLVNEYNRMVENLEESKRALAQSEKETAWREMAKQVAHEIKNPLTPMKLTLQQMEEALKSGHQPPMEKSQKSVEVLLKQVDILNEIAASFSSFASMPAPSPQKVDLNIALQETANLYAAGTEGKVNYSAAGGTLIVSVDETSFSRAISNIIINALQAKQEGEGILVVSITASALQNKVLIAIRDNGKGMSKEVQEKVFLPQFTTKHSGSGLGLAMTKQIITQAGGKIWFESVINRGTTFFIELPLVG